MKRSVYRDTGINCVEEPKDNIIILRLVNQRSNQISKLHCYTSR